MQFWDGNQLIANGAVEGGSGTWGTGITNWTDVNGMTNQAWTNSFAVFQGAAGTVTVNGVQAITGMQFITDGYSLQNGMDGSLNLVNSSLGNVTVRVDPSVTATMDVALNGAGTLGKYDTGTLVLNGANSYSGGTQLDGGTLVVSSNTALGTGTLTAETGTRLDSNTTVILANTATLNGNLTVLGSNALTLNGVINGVGSLTKNGTSNLTLNGMNTYSGGTTLNAGTLQIGDGGTSGSLGTGNVINNGNLILNRSDNVIVTNNISGTGGLTHSGVGSTTLLGNNSYSGGTIVNSGSLIIGTSQALSQNSNYFVNAGAILDLNGYSLVASNIAGTGVVDLGSGNLTMEINAGETSGLVTQIQGEGHLVKQGAGALTLDDANTFSGGVDLKQGRINLGHSAALGNGLLSMDDGTAIGFVKNNLTIANNLHMTGSNDPEIDTGSNNATWSGNTPGLVS